MNSYIKTPTGLLGGTRLFLGGTQHLIFWFRGTEQVKDWEPLIYYIINLTTYFVFRLIIVAIELF